MNLTETDRVKERYARRKQQIDPTRYDPLMPAVYLSDQERERALIRLFNQVGLTPVRERRLIEIGCGEGPNLLDFLRLGFLPENLVGIDLLQDSADLARRRLPEATRILCGDASEVSEEDASFDIVYQATVFSSLLDDDFQQKLADRMWALVKPGGGVLWYDFIYNNPRNPDVRGVPLRRVRALFPEGQVRFWRVTLAPPISRPATRLAPGLYGLLNAFPFLRTNVLCWIRKESGPVDHG